MLMTKVINYLPNSNPKYYVGWLGNRVVSVLDSGAEGSEFKSQPRRCKVTVLGNSLFTPIVPLFAKLQNWQQHLKGCEGNCWPGGK